MARYQLQQIRGVIPALLTPFDQHEEVDEDRLRRLVDHLVSRKCHGLYITGGTGESSSMTPDERKRVVRAVVDQAGGRIPLVAHIGAPSTKIAIALAQDAEDAGVDAIASVPPLQSGAAGRDANGYFRDLATATALPLIVYNIPSAGLLTFAQIQEMSTIEGIGGIKYTDTAHFQIMRMKQEIGEEYMVYSGCDEMAMSGLAYGADGVIGSYYNLMPELFTAMYEAMLSNDWERAIEKQRIANTIIMFASGMQYLAVIKRAMAWMGIDCGYCRRPLTNLDDAEETLLKDQFIALRREHKLSGVEFLDAIKG